jgi:flagellar biosynthetic protein FlhB
VADDQEQKTEKPTGKRISEAMERGRFAKAPEIQVCFTMAAVLGVLAFTARTSSQRIAEFAVGIFTNFTSITVRTDTMTGELGNVLMTLGVVLLPVLGACAGAALLAGGLQTGFNLSPKAVGFDLTRLNPAAGFGQIFNKSKFVTAGFDALKIIAVGFTLYLGAQKLLVDPLFTSPIETAYLGQFLNSAAITFFSRMLFAIGLLGAASFGYEKFKLNKELMMTKEEVKDEARNQEQDSKVKGAMKRLARRLLQKQMLATVPTADVIITNPTHYAVALKYERGRDQAPVILAKGENRFARRIKELAAEHGVPVVENKPVARVLYGLGRVGEPIPAELYQAVAQILAVVYRTHRYYFYRLRARRIENAA